MAFLFSANQAILAEPAIWVEESSSFFSAEKTIIRKEDGTVVHSGFFRTANIVRMVDDHALAKSLATKSDQYDTQGKFWFWSGWGVFIVGSIGGAAMGGIGDGGQQDTTGAIGSGILISSALYFLTSIILSRYKFQSSRHYLFKSINAYNGVHASRAGNDSQDNGFKISWHAVFR